MRISRPLLGLLFLASIGNHMSLGQQAPQEFLKRSTYVGHADTTLEMKSMLFAFQLQNEQELNRMVEDQQNPNSALYHQWITAEEFGKRFGVSEEKYRRVVAWLQQEGFSIAHQYPNRLSIYFDGTAAQVERAFQVGMGIYEQGGKRYYSNDRVAQVPLEFQDVTLDVLHLDNFPKEEPVFKSGSTTSMGPSDMAIAYNLNSLFSSGINGTGQTVAIVARTDFNVSDVHLFRSSFGLPVNDPQKVFVTSNPGDLGGNEETEVLMDAEWSGAMAPNATIKVVIAGTLDITASIDYIVNNPTLAHVMSISFGFSELQQASSARTHAINSFSQAATEGQTVFVSSGDQGAQQPTGASSLSDGQDINYLCASPNVVCVGGTNLNNNFDSSGNYISYAGETAWSGSGGGKSSFISKPSFQYGPGVPSDGWRDVPDVAALAYSPGAFLYKGGSIQCCVAGTSLAAPLWAGIFGLVNQAGSGSGMGAANSRIYEMARSQFSGGTTVFHDVISGNNSTSTVPGFSAGVGYDQVTGWGSFNADPFVRGFASTAPAPSAPIIDSLSAKFNSDGSLNLNINGRDSAGNVKTLAETRLDSNGQVLGSGTFDITALVGTQTSFSFTFNVTSGNLLSNTRQVQVKLTDANGVDSNTMTANISPSAPIIDSLSGKFNSDGSLNLNVTGRDSAGNVKTLTETRLDSNGQVLGSGTFDVTALVGTQTSFSFALNVTSGNLLSNTRQVQVKLTDANGIDSNTMTANISTIGPIIDSLSANFLSDGTFNLNVTGRDSTGNVKTLMETRLDSNGQVLGSGTFDVTALAGTQTSFSFILNITSGNLLSNTRQVQIKLTDANGIDSNTTTVNFSGIRITQSITAGGSVTSSTAGVNGTTQAGYAKVAITTGTAPYGTAVFSYKPNGVTVSEAGVPASPPTTAARIFIDYRSSVAAIPGRTSAGTVNIDTGIAVVNYGSASANLTYTLRNMAGNVAKVGHGTLAAGAHFATFIDQLSTVAPDFILQGLLSMQFSSLEISSDQPVSALALRMTTNQRKEALFTTTPTADLTQPLSYAPIYFPQFADGGGYTTSLVLLNTSNTTETGTLQLLDGSGKPIRVNNAVDGTSGSVFTYTILSGGAFRFQTDGSPTTLTTGWAQLTPALGTPTPIGAGVFGYNPGAFLVTESGIPAAVSTKHARIYVDLSGGHDTGLSIANLTSTNANITITAFQSDGVTGIGTSQDPLQLSANGYSAFFADQFIAGLPAGFTGVLDITSSTQFAALTVRSLYNERQEYLLATFPIADMTVAAPSPIVFPHIADGGGYVTQFILIGAGGAASVTLNYYGDDGKPLAVGK